MGIIPAGVGLFPLRNSPQGPRAFPRELTKTYRRIDLSLMSFADSGPIPLDRSYRDPWRVLCLAIVMEARNVP